MEILYKTLNDFERSLENLDENCTEIAGFIYQDSYFYFYFFSSEELNRWLISFSAIDMFLLIFRKFFFHKIN